MAESHVPIRICDRPGCGARITSHGRTGVVIGQNGPLEPPSPPGPDLSMDLCRDCYQSLWSWWTAKDRRAIKASSGGA